MSTCFKIYFQNHYGRANLCREIFHDGRRTKMKILNEEIRRRESSSFFYCAYLNQIKEALNNNEEANIYLSKNEEIRIKPLLE